jgi:hypothetical protein
MHYHKSHKNAIPILHQISKKISENHYNQIIDYDFFLSPSPIINLFYIENESFKGRIEYVKNHYIKMSEFINILKNSNKFIILHSIDTTNSGRIKKIFDILEESDDIYYNFKYVETDLCPILDAPYIKKFKEN